MRHLTLHRWNVSPRRASTIQIELRERLILRSRLRAPRLVAGADVACNPATGRFFAAVVLLELPGLQVVEVASATGRARFPYIPGYLSFREAPILLKAFRRLKRAPDLVFCDGQGIAHPRGFGLASHIGLLLDLPTIGCAKSRLVGTHPEPGGQAGAHAPLHLGSRQVGSVVRTRAGISPIYVSPGHRMGLRAAVRWTLACCAGRRVPEPTRLADREVNRLRAESGGSAGRAA